MRSEPSIRQPREIFKWIREEAFPNMSAEHLHWMCPEYLPPVVIAEEAEKLVRQTGSVLRQVKRRTDRLLATASYEDCVDPAGCCVVLVIRLQRAAGDGDFCVEHTWLNQLGVAAEKLLMHSIELSTHGESRALSFAFRMPVYCESVVKRQPRDTILLVEDDEFLRNVTREVLETGGHPVLVAHDAEEALRVFGRRQRDIRLLIADVTLPGRSGVELASRVHGCAPWIPILLMSGYGNLVHANAARGLFFLEKQFGSDVLMRAVQERLQISARKGIRPEVTLSATESC